MPFPRSSFTGFPFDDSDFGDRDRSFRSHIDDIVQRHPELAEHLNFDRNFERFPFRSNTWGHKRRGSATTGDESKPSGSTQQQQQQQPENRRFGRPFGSRFEERFGFPFSKTFDGEPEYYQQQKAQPQPQAQPKPQEQQPPQTQPQQQTPQEPEKKVEPEEKATEKPPQVPNNERGRKQNPNLPQSSTVDLGQKQDPLYDTRGQRSMSAPPENRAGQQPRYVSSINIPMSGGDPNAAAAQPQPQAPPQPQQWQQQQPPPPPQPKAHPTQQSKSTERVIPIHVEGRDEPVIPKRANPAFTQAPPQPERVFAPPQQERVFGQRPAGFGHWDRGDAPYYAGEQFFPGDQQFFGEPQYFEGAPQFFMNRGEPQQRPADEFYAGPFRQQQKQQPQPQPPQPQQKPQPPPQQQQQQQQQQPAAPSPPQSQQQQQPTPPPQPPQPPRGPIEQIHCIQKDVLQLMDQVEKFNGQPRDKQYLFLDEMLTRDLLKLDDIDTEGKENIRLARKEAINCIQRCISILEAKAAANEQIRNTLMDVDAKLENPNAISAEPIPLGSLEVSGVSRSGSAVAVEPEQVENATPMEVAPSADNAEAKVEEPIPLEAPEGEAPKEEAPELKEGEPQTNEEPKLEGQEGEQTAAAGGGGDAATSQSSEATKEEVKEKKDKKKVKKKEKSVDKTEKK